MKNKFSRTAVSIFLAFGFLACSAAISSASPQQDPPNNEPGQTSVLTSEEQKAQDVKTVQIAEAIRAQRLAVTPSSEDRVPDAAAQAGSDQTLEYHH